MSKPLHQDRPTTRFGDRADEYAKHRPSYPAEAIDAIVKACASGDRQLVCADVGAGTGISSRLLGDRGVRVIGIEPNAAMREAALPHALKALAEFRRILRAGGVVALVWNDRDESDPFTREYGRLILDASGNHPAARRFDHHGPLRESALFTSYRELEFPFEQRLDAEGLAGRARSASYCPKEGEGWDRLRAALLALHARFADARGAAALRYLTKVYIAERRSE